LDAGGAREAPPARADAPAGGWRDARLGRSVLEQLLNSDIAVPQKSANLATGFQLPFNLLSICGICQ
jgi:hypothetical protein